MNLARFEARRSFCPGKPRGWILREGKGPTQGVAYFKYYFFSISFIPFIMFIFLFQYYLFISYFIHLFSTLPPKL